ncbi:MAG: DUF4258 domain-containing protein [Balneolaceae bacterium]|nr:MAG: DUF4258 domain-containing protein [Balneolaceae bacterium]
MSVLYVKIRNLIRTGSVRISEHGYDELVEDGLTAKELLNGVDKAQVVEEYPDYPKGKCILLLQKDKLGNPVHVLWGIPKGHKKPAVLVTAYRPNPKRWDRTFLHRTD